MPKTVSLSLAILGCWVLAGACGPTMPSSASVRHDGQWSGTTAQGRPISFTISSDEKVTAFSIGYSFNGCSSAQTFSDLSLSITSPNVVCAAGQTCPDIPTTQHFGYSTGNPVDGPYTLVNATFLSASSATGSATFINLPGCGTATGIPWTATKR